MPLDAPTWEDTTEAPTWQDTEPEQAGPVAPPPLTSDQQQAIGTIKQKVLPIVGDIYGALTGPATQEASELGRKRLGLESGIQKAAQASQKEQTAANLYGAGETAARSLDFLGAAGRVLTTAGEKAEDVVKDVEDWKPTEGDFTMPRTIGGQNIVRPPPGAVESGVLGMARTAPVIAGAMGLQATGVPMPLAFGALSAAETAGQGAGPGEIVQSGLTGAAIPESGAIGKGAAVKLLNTAVDRGLLSADRTLVQKGVEALASQTGMQLFMGGMSLPDYMALPPDQRKQKLKENIIQNAAWLAMEVPGLLPGRPSETQARMSPTTVAASALNRMVNDPKLITAIDENIRQWVPSPKYGITPAQARTATETPPPVPAEKPTGATLKTGTQPLSGTQEPIYNAEDWARYQDITQRIAAEPDPMKKAPLIGERETLKEKYSNAVPAQVTASPQDLIPALRTKEGQEIPGQKGGSHDDIYEAQGKPADSELRVSQPEHGFLWKGKFLSRRQAADLIGEKDELHSERLAELQKAKPEAPKLAAPAPEAKEPWQIRAKDFTDDTPKAMIRLPDGTEHVGKDHAQILRRLFREGKTQIDWPRDANNAAIRKLVREMSGFSLGSSSILTSEVGPGGMHEAFVKKAIQEGKPVPPEVLADYPDLAAKAPAPAPVTPAAAPVDKVRAEVKKVAETEGQKSAKDVKKELLNRIEDATHGAPEKSDYLEGKHGFVEINIPGDGAFRVPRNLEALEGMRSRVKAISTVGTSKAIPPKIPTGEHGKIDADEVADTARKMYGDDQKAIAGIERQLASDQEMEPGQRDLLERAAGLIRESTPEAIRDRKRAELTSSIDATTQDLATAQKQLAETKAGMKSANGTSKQRERIRHLERWIEENTAALKRDRQILVNLEQAKPNPEAAALAAKQQPQLPGVSVGPGAASPGDVPRQSQLTQLSQVIRAQSVSPRQPFGARLRGALDLAGKWGRGKDIVTQAVGKLTAAKDALWNAYKTLPPWNNFTATIGRWVGADSQTALQVREFQKAITKAIPNKMRREAITNWIQADGDEATLRDRAAASKPHIRKGYEAALTLNEAEKTIARNIQSYFESRLQEGIEQGILKQGVEHYITQIWNQPTAATQKLWADLFGVGTLNPNFKFAKKRIFESYFEGEQSGHVPKNKDVGHLIAVYDMAFNRALSARAMIRELHGGTAKDGKPIVMTSGRGIALPQGETPPEAILIKPNYTPKGAVSEDGRPYRPIDHWALRDWKWAQKTGDTSVFVQGDMLVHPDHWNHLNNVLKSSRLQQHPITGALLKAGALAKQTKLSLSPFHTVQEGVHALSHRVNPIKPAPIDLNDPIQKSLVDHGLMVADPRGYELFTEGMAGGGLVGKIPGLGHLQQAYTEMTFRDYIPRLKMAMAQDALARNRRAYAKDIASGRVSDDQIVALTARESNAAFGEQNYRLMGRSPNVQDFFRLTLLAPDFLEARFRFVAQALKPYGREQRIALALMGATLYTGARVLNKALDDDYHWAKPFSVFSGGKEYRLRTVLGDVQHLLTDPRSFWYNRLSPITRTAGEYVTSRDDRGIKRSSAEQFVDFLSWFKPIPMQIRPGESVSQSLLASAGVPGRRYGKQQELYEVLDNWRSKQTDPAIKEAYDRQRQETHVQSIYGPLRLALASDNLTQARREYQKLLQSRTPERITASLNPERPFTGSRATEAKFIAALSPEQKKIYEQAREERRRLRERLDQITQQQTIPVR